jgi:hypothetical protein
MLQTLAAQHWLIEEGYLNRILAILQSGRSLESLIKKQTIQDYVPRLANLLSVAEVEPHASAHDLSPTFQLSESSGLPVVQTKQGNVALIPVIGALAKYGDMCSYGMQDYQSMIARANADPSIDGMVLVMDTPGGTVDGTPEFGLSVKNSPKPVGVFGDGMVASAGMWVASQADVIVGNKNQPHRFWLYRHADGEARHGQPGRSRAHAARRNHPRPSKHRKSIDQQRRATDGRNPRHADG